MIYPEYINRIDAKRLIAERTCPPHESLRAWKNKIDGQINTRIKNKLIAVNSDKKLFFLDVSSYAKGKFPGKFDEWPTKPLTASVNLSMCEIHLKASGVFLPKDLADCHSMIIDLYNQIDDLKSELIQCKQIADELGKNAKQWLAFKNKSGRRGNDV